VLPFTENRGGGEMMKMHDANRLKQLLPQAAGNKIFWDATTINDNWNGNKLKT
jgi:hypothetical protein